MNIIFFGTPHFAAKVLSALLEKNLSIKAVVTQPDRKKGRSLKLGQSEVKELLLEKAPTIPILQPSSCKDPLFLKELKDLDADLYVVVAYGQILPQKLLDIPSKGCINVHASLLPKYRGAAPMQRCLMNGDTETGVSVQKMVLKMDAGDVIGSSSLKIPEDMTCKELEENLIELSIPLLLDIITSYQREIPQATAQNHDEATYAAKIEVEDARIKWEQPNHVIHNLIRGLSPKPGAWTLYESKGVKKRLKIFKSKISLEEGAPGSLLPKYKVGCQKGSIELIELQPEGKRVMSASDWLRGVTDLKFL